MKRLLISSLIITPLLTACSPESGVSEKGVQACIRESARVRTNNFTAEKIYQQCLKGIDKKLAFEKEEMIRKEREKEYQRRLAEADRKEKEEYERNREAIKREKEAKELITNREKYKNIVLQSRDEFVMAGWELVGEGDNHFLLVKDRERVGFSHAIQYTYYLRKDIEPFLTPKNYFKIRFSRDDGYDWTNDNDSFVINCDTRKHSRKLFWENNIKYSDLYYAKKAKGIRGIEEWNEPFQKSSLGYLASNYACELFTEEGKKSDAIRLVINKYDSKLRKRLEGTGVNPAYMAWDNGDCKVTVKAGTHQPKTFSAMDWYEVDVCKRNVVQIDLTKR
jgi:hypothetical protein